MKGDKSPAVEKTFEEQSFGSTQPQSSNQTALEKIWGRIPIVSSAPSWTPRGRLIDSFALYVNGGTRRLYVYDYSSASWHYASLT